eukprot:s107_g32.t1
MKLIFAFILLPARLLVHGYRPESILSVAHVLSEDRTGAGEEAGEEAKDTKGVEPPKDCYWHRKAMKNWKVTFEPLETIQKRIEDVVRVQSDKTDPEELRTECPKLEEKDIRLSNTINCEDPGGEHMEGQAKFEEGMRIFRLKTSNATVVLKRVEGNNDSAVIGDWTFETGDFSIVKAENGKLELQQKMNKSVSYSGVVTQPEPGSDFRVEMKVVDSECAKFKVSKCPDLCQDNGTSCKADEARGHNVTLKIHKDKPNEMTRIMDDAKTFAALRSFVPVDADKDAFVCVKVNESQKVKDAEDSQGMKVFEDKGFGKKVLQENHIMIDSIFNQDGHQPPWKKSIQATVEWKKAMVCPAKFPICYNDGDCVSEDCKNGCDWSKSPTMDSKEDLEYNYIAGADTYGTACDVDSEAIDRVDYILNVGDNFYWGGISATCGNFDKFEGGPQWTYIYENMYHGPLDNLQWLSVLGNHDWGGELSVTVRAPTASAGRAAELLGYISLFQPGTESAGSDRFELVSSVGDPEVSSPPRPRTTETRDSILRSFVPCPARLFSHSSRLCGSALPGKDRVERAWLAGQWAAAVRAKRVGSPNRTPTIDLRSRFYAVLRAPGLSRATIFRSSASYWACVGSLEGSDSISQSFPSEIESRIYLEAAGETQIDVLP